MENKFVSRAGEKLEYALKEFQIDVKNLVVADFGSSTGGFVDCLLKNGAKKVYSVDTADNVLSDEIKQNEKVQQIVGNAMHIKLEEEVDLITIDVAWTRQRLIIPNARRNLKENGYIISLIKPQYEAEKRWLTKGVVEDKFLGKTLDILRANLKKIRNLEIIKIIKSRLKGSKGKNAEYLMLCRKISE